MLVPTAQAGNHLTAHDRQVIRFFQHHPELAATPEAGRVLSKLLPRVVASIRSTQSVTVEHLALWECIHSGEGAWDAATGNGYYGGLQMTAGWYGGSGHTANTDPPSVQMAAAEAQYRSSGYSRSWLAGQWPNTSPPCMGYA